MQPDHGRGGAELRAPARCRRRRRPRGPGRSSATRSSDVNSSELWVSLDPSADYDDDGGRRRGRSSTATRASTTRCSTYPQERIDDVLADAGRRRGQGPHRPRLRPGPANAPRRQADEVRDADRRRSTASTAPRVELPVQEPTLEVEVDLERAQALGVKPGDVRRAAATLLSGIEVGNLFEEQKVFEVVVWGTPETRTSLGNVATAAHRSPRTAPARSGSATSPTCGVTSSPTVIDTRTCRGTSTSGSTSRGRDVDAVGERHRGPHRRDRLPARVPRRAARRLPGPAVGAAGLHRPSLAAAVGIFLLLQAAFAQLAAGGGAVRGPAGSAGGRRGRHAHRRRPHLDRLARRLPRGVRAGRTQRVVLVERCQDLEDREGEPFGPELVRRAARERLAPTLHVGGRPRGWCFCRSSSSAAWPASRSCTRWSSSSSAGSSRRPCVNLLVVPALYLRFGARAREPGARSTWSLDLTEPPSADEAGLVTAYQHESTRRETVDDATYDVRAGWSSGLVAHRSRRSSGLCRDSPRARRARTEPVKLVEVEGSDVQQVVLTDQGGRAARHQDGRRSAEQGRRQGRARTPRSSTTPAAKTWAYTSPKPLTFVRAPITVDGIDGDDALLSAGPDAGTEVVTVGNGRAVRREQEIGH